MSTNPSRKPLNPADGQGKGGREGYNKPKADYSSSLQHDQKHDPAYTISGYDLTKYVKKEKQYEGMAPMERFLYEGGSSLERKSIRKVPKGLL